MVHGLCHFEIQSTDLDKSRDFYSTLFNWKFHDVGAPDYVLFSAPEGPGGGIEKADVTHDSNIKIYIEVTDMPRAVARARELGAEVVKEKTLISEEHGYWAMIADPCGVRIGLWSRT